MKYVLTLLFMFFNLCALAQISGVVQDAISDEAIALANIRYEDASTAVMSDNEGKFSIPKLVSRKLKISAVGYKTDFILINKETSSQLTIRLEPESYGLSEVSVTGKKQRYSRRNNPAVELMKRVISQKDKFYISNLPHYEYEDYRKVIIAADDIDADQYLQEKKKAKSWFINQVEYCTMNEKWIIPSQMEESVTRVSKTDNAFHRELLGQQSCGMANFSETSAEFMNKVIADIAEEVDICNSNIRLLQQNFVSPVSNSALLCYHFFLSDTLLIDKDECIRIDFTPANKQDFGFNGSLYVCNDSLLNIKRVELSMPSATAVNFIKNIKIEQDYRFVNGNFWSLSNSKMMLGLNVLNIADNIALLLSTKRDRFAFEAVSDEYTIDKAAVNLENNDVAFWEDHRSIPLSSAEQSIANFTKGVMAKKGIRMLFKVGEVLVDDYVGLYQKDPKKNVVEFGPVKSIFSSNLIDGPRVLLGARTTPALSDRIFLQGYAAHGFRSDKWYYFGQCTYSFNKIYKQPWEYPMHQLSVSTEYDILSPAQKFLEGDKNSVFTSFSVKPLKNFYWYRRNQIEYKKEFNEHWLISSSFKLEKLEPATSANLDDGLFFQHPNGTTAKEIRTTEWSLCARYAIGEKYIFTKTGRYPINKDVTVISLRHSVAIPGMLGGKYLSNMSELSLLHRTNLRSWGYSDLYLQASSQWNKVPYPLLIMPKTNLSWFTRHDSHTFLLMDDLEFITDRELVWDLSWSPNGKLFNRIPLIKKLKLREFFAFRGMLGTLTDKNNPYISNDNDLFVFPTTTKIIGATPYMEIVAGISNIFKFFEIDYVRRLNYHAERIHANGIRFAFNFNF